MITSVRPALRAGIQQNEAAAVLGVSTRTLRKWLHAGYGPQPTRDGGRLLYDRASLQSFMAGVR